MSITTLQPAGQWAQNEFAFAELGDPRRSKRLVKIATQLADHPGGTLPQAFEDWAELKAAYWRGLGAPLEADALALSGTGRVFDYRGHERTGFYSSPQDPATGGDRSRPGTGF